MKKIISWILALSMCSGMFGNFAYAENTTVMDADIMLEDVQITDALPLEEEEMSEDVSAITEESLAEDSVTDENITEAIGTDELVVATVEPVSEEIEMNIGEEGGTQVDNSGLVIESGAEVVDADSTSQIYTVTLTESSSEKTWVEDGTLSKNVGANVATGVGNVIYIMSKAEATRVYKYDTVTKETSNFKIPYTLVYIEGMVSKGEYVYVLANNTLYRFTSTTNYWEELCEMGNLNNGVLMVYEGEVCYANKDGIHFYDTSLNEWRRCASFHEAITNDVTGAYEYDGRVYICTEYSKYVYMFDKNEDITTLLTCEHDLFNRYHSYISCGKDGQLFLVGGYKVNGVTVEDWDSETGEWLDPGYGDYEEEATSTSFMCDFNNNIIAELPNLAMDSRDHSLVYCNGHLYAVGGTKLKTKVYSYDVRDTRTVPQVERNRIAVGESHMLSLDGHNEITAQGNNTYGQLGIGSYEDSESGQLIEDFTAASIYAGDGFSAALKNTGSLWMWGKNDSYQLAMEDTAGTTVPYEVMDNIVKVSFGNNHVLALSKEGTVYAWGGNEYGELGNVAEGLRWVPRQVNVSSSKIVDIAAGGEHSVALDENGVAYTWGNNSSGQIMTEPATASYITEAQQIPVNNVYDIQAGANHTLLLGYDGNVYTLGSNSKGQLGLGLTDGYSITPTAISSLNGVVKILAKDDISYIWCGNGKIYAFGDNHYGMLGVSSNEDFCNAPMLVDTKAELSKIFIRKDTVIGYTDNGLLYTWGLKTDDNPTNHNLLNINYPMKITQVDSYRNQTLAIDETGTVIAWGEGYYANGSISSETYYYPMRIDGITEPVQVSRGKNHNLVLDANGVVWGWGSNSNNPMGALDGKVEVATKLDGFTNVKKVAAGTEFSVVLKNDGTLWGVGKNDRGQMCREDTTTVTTPIQLTDKTDFIDVSVGESYVAAIASDGIYTWGGNEKGQLGNGTIIDSYTSNKIEVDLEENEYFTNISAGIDFCMALTNLGNVYAWGKNGSGELGQGDRAAEYEPTKISRLSNIRSIEAGKSTAYAISNDGVVYGWGYATDGQLVSLASNTTTPTIISSMNDVGITDVSLGYAFVTAINSDGELYASGNMTEGKLGYYAAKPVLDKSSNLVKDALWLNSVMAELTASPLTENITLRAKGEYGSKITWISSNDYYIDSEGTVHRPDYYGTDTAVKLYATISNGVDKFTPTYTAIVKQDPTIQPSTDVLDRTIGFEYEQIYPEETPEVYPEIVSVSYVPDEDTPGVYQLFVENTGNEEDDQFKCSTDNPFFFWSSRQGTFKPVNGHEETFDRVLFTVDDEYLDDTVKVTVGIGDNLGYIDKKYITLEPAVPSETSEVAEVSEIALLSEDSSSASVSLAIGLDMSANMQKFDTTSYKTWMSSVEGLIESAGGNVDLALLTDSYVGYPVDTEAAKTSLEFLKTNDYSGDTDVETMLDRCIASLQDSENMSQYVSKVAVVFANKVSDAENLKNKISELEQQGIAVYVMLLGNNETVAFEGIENIYDCDTELSLRLHMSELYNAFSSMAQVMTADSTSTSAPMISDFKYETHALKLGANATDVNNLTGGLFASILGLYASLPVYTAGTNGYNLFKENNNEQWDYYSAEDVKDIVKGDLCNVTEENATNIAAFYQNLLTGNTSSKYITAGEFSQLYTIIDENLKYRFPVLVFDSSNIKEGYIITEKVSENNYTFLTYDLTSDEKFSVKSSSEAISSATHTYSVFDTYSYLLTLSALPTIYDEQDGINMFYSTICFTIPSNITISKETIRGAMLYNNTTSDFTYSCKSNSVILNYVIDGAEYVFGIQTTYNGLLPDLCNTSKLYKVIQYDDEKSWIWYYPYLYRGTNLGMITGDEVQVTSDLEETNNIENISSQATDTPIYFNAQKTVSRSEYLAMLLRAAKVDVPTDSSNSYWATDFINKAIELGLIREVRENSASQIYDQTFYDDGISMCEAAFALIQLFLYNEKDTNTASIIHEYNENISSIRSMRWYAAQNAYTDQNDIYKDIVELKNKNILISSISEDKYYDSIGQVYMNTLLDGDINKSFNASGTLNKANAAKLIIKSLFVMNDGLTNVKTIKMPPKTVHIILYDSIYDEQWTADNQILCAPLSTDEPIEITPNPDDKFASIPRYMNEDEKRFEYENTNKNDEQTYDIDFFRTYFKLLRNSNATFSISIRDLDFNRAVKSDNAPYDFMANIPKFPVYKELATKLGLSEDDTRVQKWELITEQTANRIIDIAANMKMAYDSLATNERPMKLPKIFIGTPHLQTDTIALGEEMPLNEFVDSYTKMAKAIYEKVINGGIEENRIAGIYFGREDPDDTSNKENDLSWNCKKSMAEYAHSIGKKVIWMPYTCGDSKLIGHIADVVNNGYVDEYGNVQNLCDIVIMQPGIFFHEVTPSDNYQDIMDNYIYNSVVDQVVYSTTEYTDRKSTTTQIFFQMEYDLSLVTGRLYNGISTSTEKKSRFIKTIEIFEDLIYDNVTSFGIYSGGPSEQNYNNIEYDITTNKVKVIAKTTSGNENYHSHRNHLAVDEKKGHLKDLRKYNQFTLNESGFAGTDISSNQGVENIPVGNTISGNLIFQITEYLINDINSDKLKIFVGNINGI